MSLLNLSNITITVSESGQEKVLVKNCNLKIPDLSFVALVGGSGSGKTTMGLSILRLLPLGLNIKSGRIEFQGENLLEAKEERMRQLRGQEISMVFQEPLYAFNPVFSIGDQIDEVLEIHTDLNKSQRQDKIQHLLDLTELKDPERVAQAYPHQLSGGMRQRAMIAQAIAADPKLIIADEPTSNLDVTLQARIMELFRKLKDECNLSILLISHDLGMVSHLSDYVAVMKAGEIIEDGKTEEVLNSPHHPYTIELIDAL